MISIIVPVYDVEKYLEQCLDSLSGQTFRDMEIVCIDDGSTDRSAAILADYARRESRLKVITQNNQGISAARNRGIEASQGRWLMFVDSDDWIDAVTCETAIEAAVETNADMVLWSYIREFEDGRRLPRFLMNKDNELDGKNVRLLHRKIVGPVAEELRNPALLHSWGTVWGKLYRREMIGNARFTDIRVVGSAEDVLFNIEVFNRAGKAFYINKAMYHHRKRKVSFTGSYNDMLNERWTALYGLMSDIICRNNLPADFHEALNNRIALGLIGQGLNECKSGKNAAGKINAIKRVITTPQYVKAVTNLPLKYFPPHWKIFFLAAKNANAPLLFILLSIIRKLRYRLNL